tara:strand:+ start:1438 stop:2520 length:1083 start_codon:yes stop_codon:yes gene_type:complete
MNKTLIVTNIPSSYRVDLFNALSVESKMDFHFLFIPDKSVSHKDMIWGNKNNSFFKKTTILDYNFFKIASFLKKNKFDSIIVGGIPMYFFLLVVFKIMYNTRLYCWWAGTNFTERSSFLKKHYRTFFSYFIDGYFFYSKLSYNYFDSFIRKLKNNYKIIGNNTRFAKIEADKIKKIEFIKNSTSQFQIINVGFQEERKNTIILLKAVQLLQDKGYDINTLVIGDGPELSKLKGYALNNNLINTSFLGNLNYEAVYKNLLESDLLIHPSKSDSWPQVFNEAAFCRNAIFVSEKSGVFNSYTQKYENKVLFESDNFQELSFKIENLINNKLLLTELKNATFENAKVNDGEKVIIDMLNLLSK